jgi:hypothetical protein
MSDQAQLMMLHYNRLERELYAAQSDAYYDDSYTTERYSTTESSTRRETYDYDEFYKDTSYYDDDDNDNDDDCNDEDNNDCGNNDCNYGNYGSNMRYFVSYNSRYYSPYSYGYYGSGYPWYTQWYYPCECDSSGCDCDDTYDCNNDEADDCDNDDESDCNDDDNEEDEDNNDEYYYYHNGKYYRCSGSDFDNYDCIYRRRDSGSDSRDDYEDDWRSFRDIDYDDRFTLIGGKYVLCPSDAYDKDECVFYYSPNSDRFYYDDPSDNTQDDADDIEFDTDLDINSTA